MLIAGAMVVLRVIDEETGQDLTEFALLLAFVVIAAASIFLATPASITAIWTSIEKRLEEAANLLL
jgi:Flp pilus assembly pilin Flp